MGLPSVYPKPVERRPMETSHEKHGVHGQPVRKLHTLSPPPPTDRASSPLHPRRRRVPQLTFHGGPPRSSQGLGGPCAATPILRRALLPILYRVCRRRFVRLDCCSVCRSRDGVQQCRSRKVAYTIVSRAQAGTAVIAILKLCIRSISSRFRRPRVSNIFWRFHGVAGGRNGVHASLNRRARSTSSLASV